MFKFILRAIIKNIYKVKVEGIDNYKNAGDKIIIIANHTSFLDALLLGLFLPDNLVFAVNTQISKKRFLKPLLRLAKTYSLDPTNPMATKGLIEEIKKNDSNCVIFPEGRITVTGSLMKVYEGPGMIADKSGAKILPIRIDGAQYSPFSRLKGKVRIKWFPEIKITILPHCNFNIDEEIKGRKRRHLIGNELYDIMSEMMFTSSFQSKTLFQSILDARKIHGNDHEIIEDVERKPVNYKQLIIKSFALGNKISEKAKEGDTVGILLPNMNNTIITFFAMQSFGIVPAMLNFSTGSKNLISACKTAEIKIVYTSRRFIELSKLSQIIDEIKANDIEVVYLEDVGKKVSFSDKISAYINSCFPKFHYNKICKKQDSDIPAVILFTSGSEGTPKGVVLSHNNLQANIMQLGSRIDFSPLDKVFNSLPVFHSFGLTGGTLLPILSGMKIFFYPSPLHYRIVPELIYDTNSTIMFGTDTFLTGYARFAHAYDFYSLRYIFAGAEKLHEETRKVWSEKYGVRIFEGYGATETSPALTSNTPMHNKPGTVGRLLPAIDYKLEEVPGIDQGGKLLVSGPNILHGYLFADEPGKVQPPEDNWYDTGDIVEVDEEGFISIKGRAKRFAKIAGEMVSLTAVETYLNDLWPDNHHAIISIPDKKKGEQLVLVTDLEDANRTPIVTYAQKNGISELSIPRKIKIVDKVPILGTGKTDYVSIGEMVKEEA